MSILTRLNRSLSRLAREERGSAAMVLGISLTAVIGFTALAVDLGCRITSYNVCYTKLLRHQNPPDLNPGNYKLVRFFEHKIDGVVRWFFFPDQCRHCVNPPCKMVADGYVDGAIAQDEATGAVYVTPKAAQLTAEQGDDVRQACPYDIPRVNDKGVLTKCSMCFERQVNGKLPACVAVCPTGTMNFGERSAMMALAEKRLLDVKKDFPNAMLANPDDVNVIFLLQEQPGRYHTSAVADATRNNFV